MKRYLFFIFMIFLGTCLAFPVQGAAVPTLVNSAKHRPQHELTKTGPVDNNLVRVVTLGVHSDITPVKKRVAAGNRTGRTTTTHTRAAQLSSSYKKVKKITSKSVMIMDAETGETIFTKAPDTPRQPASTIKVLTGMIAIKSLQDNELVGVSRHAQKMPRSKIYLDTRKKYKADDLINAVLLASANDASVALAEKIAGNESDFARMMTLRAKLWGAKKTVCRTANGLTARGQHTTARDLAQIFRHAMQDKEFAQRIKQTKIRTSYGKLLRNHNRALWQIKGAVGGKTGYTHAAKQTYVGKFQRGDDAIIIAIMGSHTMWKDIKRLVNYGFKKKEQIRLAKLAKTQVASLH